MKKILDIVMVVLALAGTGLLIYSMFEPIKLWIPLIQSVGFKSPFFIIPFFCKIGAANCKIIESGKGRHLTLGIEKY